MNCWHVYHLNCLPKAFPNGKPKSNTGPQLGPHSSMTRIHKRILPSTSGPLKGKNDVLVAGGAGGTFVGAFLLTSVRPAIGDPQKWVVSLWLSFEVSPNKHQKTVSSLQGASLKGGALI